jgi:parallel beta-helix repeat protein
LVWVSFLQVGDVKAQSTVYIRNDGTVEGTDKIQQNGDTYTFTDDITGAVVLEKGGIVIDGDGYTLTDDSNSDGFYWDNVDGVTIKNVRVKNCDNGFSISSSDNNTITGTTVTGNNVGIQIRFSKNSQITENSVLNNNQTGIML